ncbi:MAG: YARHG domain-containing protein [Aphanothece sp. CMT-3BRIN-NPC111]|nr:YARHG domain-containing protein [Aphanothece sp. CMT-3BRIN-NPC111]
MTSQLLNNRYRIIRALGAGGFGDTFLAEDTQMPSLRRCALKQLKPVTNNPQIYQLVQQRFQREAAILEELGDGSTQIPKLYAYFPADGHFYLVQEYIEGQSLSQIVQQQGPLNEGAVREILVSLLPVLDYVHSKRMVHRDIKPDNIMLRQRDGKPVLIDFGAVKETMGTVVNSIGNTTSSIVIGTPGFMSSEQGAGRPVYASDLYSLGLTAIYTLTGKLPQELEIDPSTGDILWHRYALSVSPSLAAVLDQAIQSHPRDRFPTARAMLDALHYAATPIPPTVPNPHPPVVFPNPTTPSVPTIPVVTPPNPALASGGREGQGNKLNSAIFGGLIATGVIGASVFIGFALKESQSSTETTAISSPAISQSAPPDVTSTPSSLASPVTSPQPVAPSPSTPAIINEPVSVPRQETPTPAITKEPVSEPIQEDETGDYSWLAVRRVTDADLTRKNAFELDIMRNSIYARHGRQFRNQELQEHFDNQSWYRPIYSPDDFSNNLLSPLERQNADYILQYQNRNNLRFVQ